MFGICLWQWCHLWGHEILIFENGNCIKVVQKNCQGGPLKNWCKTVHTRSQCVL